MRLLYTCLMVFGLLAGMHGRAYAADPCEVVEGMPRQERSDHHHDHGQPCDSSHDEKCPFEHHHHCGTCCHVSPMVSENDLACRLALPASYRLRVRPECDLIPEGPYLSSDRPPII